MEARVTNTHVTLPCGVRFPYTAEPGRKGPTGIFRMVVPVFNDRGELIDRGLVRCVGYLGLRKRAAGFATHTDKLEDWR